MIGVTEVSSIREEMNQIRLGLTPAKKDPMLDCKWLCAQVFLFSCPVCDIFRDFCEVFFGRQRMLSLLHLLWKSTQARCFCSQHMLDGFARAVDTFAKILCARAKNIWFVSNRNESNWISMTYLWRFLVKRKNHPFHHTSILTISWLNSYIRTVCTTISEPLKDLTDSVYQYEVRVRL
jgi:hypothetical protein